MNIGYITKGSLVRYEDIREIVEGIRPNLKDVAPERVYAYFVDTPLKPDGRLGVSIIKMGDEDSPEMTGEGDLIVDTFEEFELEVVKLKLCYD